VVGLIGAVMFFNRFGRTARSTVGR